MSEVSSHPFGRYYEEFESGQVVKHWPGRTITEFDDTLFCMLTMNHHPLHIDANYAEGTRFGQRVVSGPFVFSLVVGMSVADMSGKAIIALAYENIEHHAPTFHGDTLYSESEVLEKRVSKSKPNQGILRFETRGHNQKGELVISYRRSVLLPMRPDDEGRQ